MKSTRDELWRLIKDAANPFHVEYRTSKVEDFRLHSYIQTESDKRTFVEHASRNAEYRIVAHPAAGSFRHRLQGQASR